MHKITLIMLLALGLISGCDKIKQTNETLIELTNKLVTKYCLTPPETRKALHIAVKQAVAPNEITISCATDIKP